MLPVQSADEENLFGLHPEGLGREQDQLRQLSRSDDDGDGADRRQRQAGRVRSAAGPDQWYE